MPTTHTGGSSGVEGPAIPLAPVAGLLPASLGFPARGGGGLDCESAGAHPHGARDRYHTYTELPAILQRFKQNPKELRITWILRVCDQRGPTLSLNSGEPEPLGELTSDALFNSRCQALRSGCRTRLTWRPPAWRQGWESFRLRGHGAALPLLQHAGGGRPARS